MPGAIYTDKQWAEAARLRKEGKRPPEIERLTGIPRGSLYTRHVSHPDEWPRWGANRIRPERLAGMKRDCEAGMRKEAFAKKWKVDPKRLYQLKEQYGWSRPPRADRGARRLVGPRAVARLRAEKRAARG